MTVHLHIVPDARPRRRGDCLDGPRPCPYAGCRHSLVLLDVSDRSGRIWERSEEEVDALVATCALDVADRGGVGVQEIAALFGMTHQNVAVTVDRAATKLRPLLSPDMLDGWMHTSEVVPDDVDIFDADFRAQVRAAYERIVPEAERGKNAIRSAKGRST